MVGWSETEPKYKLLIIVVACLLVSAAIWYVLVRPITLKNEADNKAWQGKRAEIATLRPFQQKIAQLNRDIEGLQQQIEENKRIVPEDKAVDGFIRNVQSEAHVAGIEVRRFTSLPVVTREQYSEVPFELEIDGPYAAVLQFYERIAKMDRLVNVSALHMANVKNPSQAKVKKTYQYAPSETVVATCVASTFYSPKAPPPPPPGTKPAPGAKPAPAAAPGAKQ